MVDKSFGEKQKIVQQAIKEGKDPKKAVEAWLSKKV